MICVVIKGPTYLEARQQIERALPYADLVELRLDLFVNVDETSLLELKSIFSIPMIFTLRSQAQGGNFNQSEESRVEHIYRLAALKPFYLDLESHMPEDVVRDISSLHPEIQLILSYHNLQETPENFDHLYADMQKIPAHFYKIAVTAKSSVDTMRLLVWSKNQNAKLIPISMGPNGQISRILGPIVNHPFTFASLDEDPKNPLGQLSAKLLIEQYRYRTLTSQTAIYGLIGDPVNLSISDETHNAVLAACGMDAVYVKIPVKSTELSPFLELAKALPIRGLSVTMPLKKSIMSFIDHLDVKAEKIGAVNTLQFKEDQIYGFNTDGMGAMEALETKCGIQGKHVVIIGAGGAARAIAYEAVQKKALVTVINRSPEKAYEIAHAFGCQGKGLHEMPACAQVGYDILINCTSVPMPIAFEDILLHVLVMDIKTKPKVSLFLENALKKGCQVIFGYQMFIAQALGQFKLWFKRMDRNKSQKILEEKVMTSLSSIKTERLILRPWRESDLEPFAKLNADPRVLEYFPATLTREESDALAQRIISKMDEQGWGLWAVSLPGVSDFIGFIGLSKVLFEASFTPAVEIGWRLAYDFWGKGYAPEGALAALQYGFETLHLDKIVSFTTVQNERSRKVMEKIGMKHHPEDDFDHPRLSLEHPLSRHVLYSVRAQDFFSLNPKKA
ncbi:shikimate biosynthesis protein AroDE [Parachlamydia acanthamoebae UV-7]|uniref:Multifunctional fusion protein n=2 Tax=Parachlamydia acanthamoebae TaxID=83552 RepID=F8KXH5_PARAV|nr:shikimate dehydrogenase [Parachlamydia acanthamoebae]CCB87060.1 shikimate biosynthesis protein AroDE [Parachlamydia acanthamoebae UV-7]